MDHKILVTRSVNQSRALPTALLWNDFGLIYTFDFVIDFAIKDFVRLLILFSSFEQVFCLVCDSVHGKGHH